MKRMINVFDYAADVLKSLDNGVLLTAKSGQEVNTMTIGWGHLGIEWGKPIFIAYVRENRYTRHMLDESMEFTVNVPYGQCDKKILGYCGSKSGRDVDKIKELGLTLEKPVSIETPGIKELPLTLECKVIYRQMQNPDAILESVHQKYYPQDVASDYCGSNKDFHIVYYGEITSAYIIEE